ncbi:hypothetical protein DFR30_0630 [Thiogranum longum]|uniref:Uncharacterized protein n=1 Tax=Thiogranum longum TaxID=1537524 RepID=A0A4R1HB65_9GAMM|nr:hypothetical protein DFR30_0630 [Thiogranum longum]
MILNLLSPNAQNGNKTPATPVFASSNLRKYPIHDLKHEFDRTLKALL